MAIVNTMIPIPPNHCKKDLQKSTPCGMLSIPLMRCGSVLGLPIIVAPVVVTPDIASNQASVKFGIIPVK